MGEWYSLFAGIYGAIFIEETKRKFFAMYLRKKRNARFILF